MTTERIRSLLAYLVPREPVTSMAIWDTATTLPAGQMSFAEVNRMAFRAAGATLAGVRATVAMATGTYYWETQPRLASTSVDHVSGIIRGDEPVNLTPSGARRCAFTLWSNGWTIYDSVLVANLGQFQTTDTLRHLLNLDTGTYQVAKNAGAWQTVFTGERLSGNWHAWTAANAAGYGSRIRTGGSTGHALNYAVPAGAQLMQRTTWVPRYFWAASGRMPEGLSGGTPREVFPGRVAADRDVEVGRAVSCWVWGGQVQASPGQLVLVNADGALDGWAELAWRDADVILRRGHEGDAYSAYTVWSRGLVDSITLDDATVTLQLADPLAQVDRPLQRRLYPDTHPNAQARGRPRPIAIGRPLYCEGVLQDTDTKGGGPNVRAYEYHDGWRDHASPGLLHEITAAFDRGDVFDPPPTDWTYWPSSGERRGLKLVNQPAGRVVANVVGPQMPGLPPTQIEQVRDVVQTLWARACGYWDSARAPTLFSLGALQATAPYLLAKYFREPTTGLAAIRDCLDSFCAWLAPRRAGDLVAGRLEEPATTAVVELSRVNVIGTVRRSLDVARGLSLSLAGRENNTVHSDGDLAGAVAEELREELRVQWTHIATMPEGVLAPEYLHAEGAPPKTTWLQSPDDLQREVRRVVSLYRVRRYFYTLTATLTVDQADTLEPGQTVRLVWPRHGLANGRNLLIVSVRSRFFSNRVDLTLWG